MIAGLGSDRIGLTFSLIQGQHARRADASMRSRRRLDGPRECFVGTDVRRAGISGISVKIQGNSGKWCPDVVRRAVGSDVQIRRCSGRRRTKKQRIGAQAVRILPGRGLPCGKRTAVGAVVAAEHTARARAKDEIVACGQTGGIRHRAAILQGIMFAGGSAVAARIEKDVVHACADIAHSA